MNKRIQHVSRSYTIKTNKPCRIRLWRGGMAALTAQFLMTKLRMRFKILRSLCVRIISGTEAG